MSVAQAEEFYGPVLPCSGGETRNRKGPGGVGETSSSSCPAGGRATADGKTTNPGTEKCIALVYQGEDAVQKIREVLGPTDPSKAPPGSIRKEFGQTIMINAAHASDSAENARREMGIVQVDENNFKPLIESFYRAQIICAPILQTLNSTMEISARAAQLTPSLTLSIDSQSQGDESRGHRRLRLRRRRTGLRYARAHQGGGDRGVASRIHQIHTELRHSRVAPGHRGETGGGQRTQLQAEPDRRQQRRQACLLQRDSRHLPAGR